MKFGAHLKEIRYPDWRFYYLEYDRLKIFLKEGTISGRSQSEEWEAEFVELLELELKKVASFQQIKSGELARRVEYCERALDIALAGNSSSQTTQTGSSAYSSTPQDEKIVKLETQISEIIEEVNRLSKFTRVNYTGFLKILKKHDKHTTYMLKPMFMVRLNARPFYRENFDQLILRLSKLYDLVRTGGKSAKSSAQASGDTGSQNFVRKTTKYWVHPDNVTEVKLRVLRHLPVLIFSSKDGQDGYNPAITSIYFDNDDLELYKGRLEKEERARAIRFRWYGPATNTEIFIERKTHREDWTGESSVKQRFPMKEKYVTEYMTGEYDIDRLIKKQREKHMKTEKQLEELEHLSREIQIEIQERGLRPVLRSFYNRTAFQLPGDARVRISLDTELCMVREDNFDGNDRTQGNWRRTDIGIDHPFSQLPPTDIVRFPYAILEVKLQTQMGAEPPQWITRLINSHLVEEVPKFSKFIHGCANLLESRVKILPFWLPQMDKDIRKPPVDLESPVDSPNGPSRAKHMQRFDDVQPEEFMDDKTAHVMEVALENGEPLEPNGMLEETRPLLEPAQKAVVISTDGQGRSWPFAVFRRHKGKGKEVPFGPPVASSSSATGSSEDQPRYEHATMKGLRRLLKIGSDANLRTSRALPFQAQAYTGNKRIAVPVRIEPKVFFANERTFLSWLHFAIVLGGLSLGLLNFGDKIGQISGFLFTGISMGIIFYALYLYLWRANKIRRREAGPYDDLFGPVFVVLSLFTATVVNFWLKIAHDPAWSPASRP